MTVNYTTNLALGLPVTGTESGTWGDDVNNAITAYLDIAIAGGLSVAITTADVTLTLTQGTSAATNIGSTTAQYAILNISGAKTAARNLIVPSSSRYYIINNTAATGGYLLTVKGAATIGITLVDGEKAVVAWNGTDYVKIASSTISNLTGTLPVANGGTGLSAGTSGGVPYYSASGTIASSAALAASAIVLGGGAGVTPATTTTGTGVVTALGVNVGSAGAVVVNGGALGTPSSGTATNLTGLPLSTGVTGTLPVANGGTGLATTPANGALDIGNGTGFTRATLTAGTGVTIANAAGAITINATGTGGTVTSVTGTSPVSVATGTTTPVISLAASYGDTQNPYASKTANFVLAAPNGAAGVPTFRAIVAADIPTLNQNTTGTAAGLSATLAVASGGTGQATYAVGDVLYASGATALAKLSDVATGNALISGGVGAAPTYGKIGLTTHVNGTLPLANGGTNQTATPVAGSIIFGTGSAYSATAAGTTGQVLTSAGAGTPTWAAPAGGQIQFALFTSSTTWTCPAGVTRVKASVYGGGGGAQLTGGAIQWAGHGGAGYNYYTVVPGTVYTITVGAGGVGGTTGASGGSSSFNSFITATGGLGGSVGFNLPGSCANSLINTAATPSIYQGQFFGNSDRPSGGSAAIAWSAGINIIPGSYGSGSGTLAANATGGVGGVVFLEYVG